MAQQKQQRQVSMTDEDEEGMFYEVHEIVVKKLGPVPIAKGDFHYLPRKAQRFIAKWVCTRAYYSIPFPVYNS